MGCLHFVFFFFSFWRFLFSVSKIDHLFVKRNIFYVVQPRKANKRRRIIEKLSKLTVASSWLVDRPNSTCHVFRVYVIWNRLVVFTNHTSRGHKRVKSTNPAIEYKNSLDPFRATHATQYSYLTRTCISVLASRTTFLSLLVTLFSVSVFLGARRDVLYSREREKENSGNVAWLTR